MDFSFILVLVSLLNFSSPTNAQKAETAATSNVSYSPKMLETYIVHVSLPEDRVLSGPEDVKSWYQSFLPATNEPTSRLVHSYHHVFTGFSARLSPEEVRAMEKMEGFVWARPQRILPMHTTHSPSFLGLQRNVGAWRSSNYGEGVVIGLLDTGITPNHPSFGDKQMPPPPAKWKGKCTFNKTTCNKKIIGARNFLESEAGRPPFDEEGHGTHTSSTAAGTFVDGANVFGQANGTAAGMAPLAHLVMYKVCGVDDCPESSIVAAMDAAVVEGVDILSLSLGGGSAPFYDDTIAVGAFRATQKGILVSCSAGNSGPHHSRLSNEAPWIMTVGASSIDRSIRATAVLGNGEEYDGESLLQPTDFPSTMMPLVYAGVIDPLSATCMPGSLDNIDVKGKVVFCESTDPALQAEVVKDAGGAAMILMNRKEDGYTVLDWPFALPATFVGYVPGKKIKKYINSTATPMAKILFKGTIIGDSPAPMITSFSSRGPNKASPGILKPDIVGPGLNILAAWPDSVEIMPGTTSAFNILSGTSMSCPHLSGIAALIKSAHPDWSPAAIKSAIMTTSYRVNLDGRPTPDERLLPADIFATGAGHVNVTKAMDPGLIYNLKPEDYIPYLCGLGYGDNHTLFITGSKVKCSEVESIPEAQLNYPSFSIKLGFAEQTYNRTVTNVGPANSTYESWIAPLDGVDAAVAPHRLEFTEVNQKMTYQVTFRRLNIPWDTFVQGALQWSSLSTGHLVTIPISVKF